MSTVDVARDDEGIRFTNHAPSTLNIGAQLVYDLYAQAYYTPYGNNSV